MLQTLDTMEIALFLGLGAIFAAGLVILSRWSNARPALLAAYALVAVSFLYVGFATSAEEPGAWIGFEMTGVALFGTLAGLSLIVSPWFVVAGLALHPIWALYIHYFGAGRDFAPGPFVWATAGFDIVAAVVVAWMIAMARGPAAPTTAKSAGKRKGDGR